MHQKKRIGLSRDDVGNEIKELKTHIRKDLKDRARKLEIAERKLKEDSIKVEQDLT